MAPASGRFTDLSTELRVNHDDSRFRWLMLWSLSPTGECCCPLGSTHRALHDVATGQTLDCGSGPGKHPWWYEDGGRVYGYRNGVTDADDTRAQAVGKWGPAEGSRRWGVVLRDCILLDLDTPRALQSFRRLCMHIPDDKIMGVARTVRGWHVYLDAPGWNQRALNSCMKSWLGDWHGTDTGKISRRGFLMDVRTGDNRYAVWPDVDRRWVTADEFRTELIWAGMRIPEHRLVPYGNRAPWNMPMTEKLAALIATFKDTAPKIDIVRNRDGAVNVSYAMRELKRWCSKLAGMPPDSGRNNMLNQISFYAGARAIAAGRPEDLVRQQLRDAALRSGMHAGEIDQTISSGLNAGLDQINRTAKVS